MDITQIKNRLTCIAGDSDLKTIALELLAEVELLSASKPAVPEGCTPADAKMLRDANHSLATENDQLRRALAPFARLVSTDTLSWAMVEYTVQGDPEKQTFQRPQMQRAFNRAAEILKEGVPAGDVADISTLDLPDWVTNGKPPASPAAPTAQAAVPHWHASNAEPPKFEVTTAGLQDEQAAIYDPILGGVANSANAAAQASDQLYTMDQMRDYAQAFHRSRLERIRPRSLRSAVPQDECGAFDEFMESWALTHAVSQAKPSTRDAFENGYAMARSALAAAPAQSGEPVAEIVASYFVQGGIAVKLLDQTLPVGAQLYAAPQPSQLVEAGEPEWIAKLRKGLMLSKMTHNFTFSRDEVMALLAAPSAVVLDDGRAVPSEKGAAFEQWFSEHRDDDFGCGLSKRSAWIIWEGMWLARAASPQATATQAAQTERALKDEPTPEMLRRGALAMLGMFMNGGGPADHREPGDLELKAARATWLEMTAAQPASGGNQQNPMSDYSEGGAT